MNINNKQNKSLLFFSVTMLSVAVFFGSNTLTKAEEQIINVCVKKNGEMRMIMDEGRRDKCTRNEQLITWNVRGVAGPQGEQGPVGEGGTNIQCVRVDGSEVYFEGCNVHITKGAGSTDTKNGLGNLIIGYNESATGSFSRTGSHNLVIGPENDYRSYGGLVAGKQNQLNGANASIVGGSENQANGDLSSITGGWRNNAIGLMSWIGAGRYNSTQGVYSAVVGGEGNNVFGNSSSIGGGLVNQTTADYSSVAGGHLNTASGGSASVSGGEGNEARGGSSSVSGGLNRLASDVYDWVAGNLLEDN